MCVYAAIYLYVWLFIHIYLYFYGDILAHTAIFTHNGKYI